MSREESCTVKSNASWVMVTWGTSFEQTYTNENITFPQLHWWAVTIYYPFISVKVIYQFGFWLIAVSWDCFIKLRFNLFVLSLWASTCHGTVVKKKKYNNCERVMPCTHQASALPLTATLIYIYLYHSQQTSASALTLENGCGSQRWRWCLVWTGSY